MKVKLLFTALLASSFMFTACDKDDDKKPAKTNTEKTPVAAAGTMRAKIGGTDWSSDKMGTHAMSLQGALTISGGIMGQKSVTITVPSITKAGVYDSTAKIDYMEVSGTTSRMWSTAKTGGSAKLTITKFDTAAKKVSGTFSFTAGPETITGASGNITATEGSFTDVEIR